MSYDEAKKFSIETWENEYFYLFSDRYKKGE